MKLVVDYGGDLSDLSMRLPKCPVLRTQLPEKQRSPGYMGMCVRERKCVCACMWKD